MKIRVMVADDHPMFRDGLSAMLDSQLDMIVVARAGTGTAAVAAASEHQPDVAVLDLRMPDGGGISATIGIRGASPTTRILVLSSFNGPDDVAAALSAGAHGYLIKTAAPDEIAQAVRAVAAGVAVLSDDLITGFAQSAAGHGRSLFPELTDREIACLASLGRGSDIDETATSLGVTSKTVRNHVAAITAKLGVRDRTAAVLMARDRGLVPLQPGPTRQTTRTT